MIVNQIAMFSPLNITYDPETCEAIDKEIINTYQSKMRYLSCDAEQYIYNREEYGTWSVVFHQ